ncbi:MAG: hypothetical protein IJF49_01210 [Clostridia bacterium]|nr:hypothetical protein [Clostridia bacterium]
MYKTYSNKYRQHVFYPISHLDGGMTIDPYSYAYCACMFKTWFSEVNIAAKAEFDAMAEKGVQPWAGADIRDEHGGDLVFDTSPVLITCDNLQLSSIFCVQKAIINLPYPTQRRPTHDKISDHRHRPNPDCRRTGSISPKF